MFDDEIDSVARELTATTPPADLRMRVMARIDDGRERRRGNRLWWMATPVAAAAVVAIGVLLVRGLWRQTPQPPPVLVVADAPVPPPIPVDRTPMVRTAPSIAAYRRGAPLSRAATEGSRTPDRLPPLPMELIRLNAVAVEPLGLTGLPELSPIEPSSIAIASIDVVPIAAAPRSPIP